MHLMVHSEVSLSVLQITQATCNCMHADRFEDNARTRYLA
jgi:hypothetical protein